MSRLIKVKLALVDKDHLIATEVVADASGQWERKLLGITAIARSATLDRSFERGGFTLTIDDTSDTFKDMLADADNRKIANRTVTVYTYAADNATLKNTIVSTIKDWKRKDKEFEITCVQEFAGKMSALPTDKIITAADWPNAPASSLGQPVPFPSGVVYHMKPDGVTGGAFLALLIDARPNTKYLLTWSDPTDPARILSIEGVWSQHVLVPAMYYSLVKDVNGWEYITLDSGYNDCLYVLLNLTASASTSDATNPVAYLRENLLNSGITLVDDGDGGTTDMETFCGTSSWGVVGSLEVDTLREFLEVWSHNFDCFWRIDNAGAIHIKHIDWSSVTAAATLTDRHFLSFDETASMDEFANRLRAKLDYNYAESEWGQETITDSTDGDILPATTPIEKEEEYAIGSYAGAVKPMTSKIKYYDHPAYIVEATMTLDHYEQLSLGVLSIVTIDHYLQLSGSGKYLILSEDLDYLGNEVTINAFRLWGA